MQFDVVNENAGVEGDDAVDPECRGIWLFPTLSLFLQVALWIQTLPNGLNSLRVGRWFLENQKSTRTDNNQELISGLKTQSFPRITRNNNLIF